LPEKFIAIRCNLSPPNKLVCCLPDQAEGLTRSPKIKHITFIGSERVGRQVCHEVNSIEACLNSFQVAIAAAHQLTPVTLELGGKDPAVVLPGTDIERWSSLWMRGILYVFLTLEGHCTELVSSQNAGQNCIGIERLLVHRDQYDEVYHLILDRARELRLGGALSADDVGTGVDVGSMISRDRFQRLQDLVEQAASRGAQVDLGGGPRVHPYLTNGAFFEPTVIGEVQQDMDIAQHEREYCLYSDWIT
jgi:acyl-CoA reductase-like NAD-dependent aldehyde dehydrogenase